MVVMSLQDKESQDASTSALRTIKARIVFVVVDYPMPYIMLSSSEFYILDADIIANSHDKKKCPQILSHGFETFAVQFKNHYEPSVVAKACCPSTQEAEVK